MVESVVVVLLFEADDNCDNVAVCVVSVFSDVFATGAVSDFAFAVSVALMPFK